MPTSESLHSVSMVPHPSDSSQFDPRLLQAVLCIDNAKCGRLTDSIPAAAVWAAAAAAAVWAAVPAVVAIAMSETTNTNKPRPFQDAKNKPCPFQVAQILQNGLNNSVRYQKVFKIINSKI